MLLERIHHMNKNLILLLIPILFSCNFEDNPISVDEINQDQLDFHRFYLDIENSYNNQILPKSDESLMFYTGYNKYGLIKINPEVFSNYDLCQNDSLRYESVYLTLDLINTYENNDSENYNHSNDIDAPEISAYWLSDSLIKIFDDTGMLNQDWINEERISIDSLSIDLQDGLVERLFVDKVLGKYYVDLSEQIILSSDSTNSISICDNTYNNNVIIIKSNSNFEYEFASSKYISDFVNTEPYLNLVYDEYQELNKIANKFNVKDISDIFSSIYYIPDTLSNLKNYFFLMKQNQNLFSEIIEDSLIWSDFLIEDPLLDSQNSNTALMKININLNDVNNYEADGITFWLDNIKYFNFLTDPNEDNWSEIDSLGTEGNSIWDDGEYIEDYGLDLCNSYFEDGLGGCVSDSTFSAYNEFGTENNLIWDYGESFDDYGLDSCPDYYEDSNGGCLCIDLNDCDIEPLCDDLNLDGVCDNYFDPNQDNFNKDPSNDDWFDINNNDIWDENEGYEGNNQRDLGEPFSDFGIDGLPSDLVGFSDEGEGNGIYDFGEPFFDTGADSLYSTQEIGYNILGKQNDSLYQFGEIFLDCGVDNDCEDLSNYDNYNIDPNNDNWNDCGNDKICPDDGNYTEPDIDGSELNGIWDFNEGTELNFKHDSNEDFQEYYEDFGIDNIEDMYEIVDASKMKDISISDSVKYDFLGESIQFFDSNNNQLDDSLNVWISSIEKQNDTTLTLEVFANSNESIGGIELRINHERYSTNVFEWINKERNVAKVNSDSYLKNLTLFKNSSPNLSSSKLLLNYNYGLRPVLNFDGLNNFLINNKDIIINENNTKLKLFFEKNDSNYILESSNFIIDFIDNKDSLNTLFSFYASNDPDSLVVPFGNLLQQYITGELNFENGIMIGLNPNQYPPSYNFNNIILDTLEKSYIDIYYFK